MNDRKNAVILTGVVAALVIVVLVAVVTGQFTVYQGFSCINSLAISLGIIFIIKNKQFNTPIILMMFLVLFAYILKGVWVSIDDSILIERHWRYSGLVSNESLFNSALNSVTLYLLGAGVSCIFLLKIGHQGPATFPPVMRPVKSRVLLLCVIVVGFSLVVLSASGIAAKGKGSTELGGLIGLIVYFSTITVPMLILSMAMIFRYLGKEKYFIGCCVMLITFCYFDGVSRDSKGSLMYGMLLLIFFLYLNSVKISKKYVSIGLVMLFISVAMYPVLMIMRSSSSSVLEAMLIIKDQGIGFGEYITLAFGMVFSRFIGIGSLLASIESSSTPLYFDSIKLLLNVDFHSYFSSEVFYADNTTNYGAAPSALGFWYVIGGGMGVFFGGVLTCFFLVYIWGFVNRHFGGVGLVMQAMLLRLEINELSDGDINRAVAFRLPFYLISGILCLFMVKFCCARRV